MVRFGFNAVKWVGGGWASCCQFTCQTPQMLPTLVVMGVNNRPDECFSGIFE